MSGGPKVLFVTNFVPPYRKTFYEKLCAVEDLQWLILHSPHGGEDGRVGYRGEVACPMMPGLPSVDDACVGSLGAVMAYP